MDQLKRQVHEYMARTRTTTDIHFLDPERPYSGQPHTVQGERGNAQVSGMTIRDIYDCYIVACHEASGLSPEHWGKTVWDLPFGDMDPVAIGQALAVNLEKRMGIFPNIPEVSREELSW